MDVLHAEAEQGEQDDDGLLLVPSDVVGDGQLVHVVQAKHFLQLQGDEGQRIAVVALSSVQNARNTVDVAKTEFVVLVFGATCREDNAIFRKCFGEVGVVLAALHATVTASHNHKLADGAALDGFHHLVGEGKHLLVGEATYNLARLDLLRGLAGLGQGDDLAEVLLAVGIGGDVLPAWEARAVGGEHAVFVGRSGRRRYDAVGGEQNRAVEALELLALLPPSVAVVALQVAVLFQFRIIMRRQHLAVRVDVDARVLALFEQLLDVVEVVAADEDARTVAHADVHLRDFGVAVGGGVGFVEQGHGFHAVFAGLERQGGKFVGIVAGDQLPQGL